MVKTDGDLLVRIQDDDADDVRRHRRRRPRSSPRSTSTASRTARSCCPATPWWRSATTAPGRTQRGYGCYGAPARPPPAWSASTSATPASPRSATTVDLDTAPGHRPPARLQPSGWSPRPGCPSSTSSSPTGRRGVRTALRGQRAGGARDHDRGLDPEHVRRRRRARAARRLRGHGDPQARARPGHHERGRASRPTTPPTSHAIGLAGSAATRLRVARPPLPRGQPDWATWGRLLRLSARIAPERSQESGTTTLFDFEVDRHRGDVRRLRRGRGQRSPTAGRWTSTTACSGVAVGPTQATGNFNSVVTLERRRATSWSRSAGSTSSGVNEEHQVGALVRRRWRSW